MKPNRRTILATCHPPLTRLSQASSADVISLGADYPTPNEMSGGSFDPASATSPLWALIGGGKRVAAEKDCQQCSSQPCKAQAPLTCSACQAAHYCSRFDSLKMQVYCTKYFKILTPGSTSEPTGQNTSHPAPPSPSATQPPGVATLLRPGPSVGGKSYLRYFPHRQSKFSLFGDIATFRSLQSQLDHSNTQLLSALVAISLPPCLDPGGPP